jgi:hypothetical protein
MKKLFILCFHFTLPAGTLSAQTQTNNALKFDGIKDKIEVQNDIPYLNGGFTLQMWIKPGSTQLAPGSLIVGYTSEYFFANYGTYYYGVSQNCGTNCYDFFLYDGQGVDHHIGFTLTPNAWQQLTLVYSDNLYIGQTQVFINGSLVGSFYPTEGGILDVSGGYISALLFFGGSLLGGANWTGSMDEIRYWDHALSQSEIQSSLHCPLVGNEAGLILYYTFNQGIAGGNNTSITSAINAANTYYGYLHHGTLVGFDLTGTNSNFILNDGGEPSSIGCGSCITSVSAGSDENIYYGYAPDACVTKTASVTGGSGSFTYHWTLDRPLLSGESMSGSNTAAVTVCLKDTAQLCITVTDADNCTATDCAMIFAEDVTCTSGKSSIQKVKVCHLGTTVCVDSNAVSAHLAHGDNLGKCTNSNARGITLENSKTDLRIFPNPAKNNFTVEVQGSNNSGDRILRIVNVSGQVVKEINIKQQTRLNISVEEAGVYSVQLITGAQTITKKLVVVH